MALPPLWFGGINLSSPASDNLSVGYFPCSQEYEMASEKYQLEDINNGTLIGKSGMEIPEKECSFPMGKFKNNLHLVRTSFRFLGILIQEREEEDEKIQNN